MYSYRDAIKRTGGAYVLYPGTVDGSENEKTEYTEILPGLGAFPLSPSHDSSVQIRNFLHDVAYHLCDRVTQWENYTFERYRAFSVKATEVPDSLDEIDNNGNRQNATAQARINSLVSQTLAPGNVQNVTIYGTTRGQKQCEWTRATGLYPLPVELAQQQGIHSLNDMLCKKLLVIVAPIRKGKSPDVEVHSIYGVSLANAKELLDKFHYYKRPSHKEYWILNIK